MEKQEFRESSLSDKKKMKLWLIILLVLTMITSVIAGYLIGRNTDLYRGQIIDTIVIDSNEERKIHVSGQVVYTNGNPYQNGIVELHSEPRETNTDSKGRFFYEAVEQGNHILKIVDSAKNVIAKCDFVVSRKQSKDSLNILEENKGKYAIELAVDIRFVELAIEIDEENKILKLIPEKTITLQDDGIIRIGGKELNVADGIVVLPSGTIILTDKTVVIIDKLILPDNEIIRIPIDGYVSEHNENINSNGTVSLADSTVITLDGIKKPDGSVLVPEEPYQLISNVTSDSSPSSSINNNQNNSSNNQNSNENNDFNQSVDDGKLAVSGKNRDHWQRWESQSKIDLFYNRKGTTEDDKIIPGSSGYYYFRVENSRLKTLDITISLIENDLHLPLQISITPLDSNGKKIASQSISGMIRNGELKLKDKIKESDTVTYQLDWSWPADGNDELDTIAGSLGGIYTLMLNITAEENN